MAAPVASSRCAAPACTELAIPSLPFCATHQLAPPGKRGGWLSARRRALARSEAETPIDASMIVERGKVGKGGLWVGAKPPYDRRLEAFHLLVLCATELQPVAGEIAFAGRVLHCPLRDAKPSREEVGRALAASRRVAEAVTQGATVLVTCRQGVNRSALVAALALCRLTTMSAPEILILIRHARYPSCLFNKHFEQLLHAFASSPARR